MNRLNLASYGLTPTHLHQMDQVAAQLASHPYVRTIDLRLTGRAQPYFLAVPEEPWDITTPVGRMVDYLQFCYAAMYMTQYQHELQTNPQILLHQIGLQIISTTISILAGNLMGYLISPTNFIASMAEAGGKSHSVALGFLKNLASEVFSEIVIEESVTQVAEFLGFSAPIADLLGEATGSAEVGRQIADAVKIAHPSPEEVRTMYTQLQTYVQQYNPNHAVDQGVGAESAVIDHGAGTSAIIKTANPALWSVGRLIKETQTLLAKLGMIVDMTKTMTTHQLIMRVIQTIDTHQHGTFAQSLFRQHMRDRISVKEFYNWYGSDQYQQDRMLDILWTHRHQTWDSLFNDMDFRLETGLSENICGLMVHGFDAHVLLRSKGRGEVRIDGGTLQAQTDIYADLFWAESVAVVDPSTISIRFHTALDTASNTAQINIYNPEGLYNQIEHNLPLIEFPRSQLTAQERIFLSNLERKLNTGFSNLFPFIQSSLWIQINRNIELLASTPYYRSILLDISRSLITSHTLAFHSFQKVLNSRVVAESSIFYSRAFYDKASENKIRGIMQQFRLISQICEEHLNNQLISTKTENSIATVPLLDGFFLKDGQTVSPYADSNVFAIQNLYNVGPNLLSLREWMYQVIPHNTPVNLVINTRDEFGNMNPITYNFIISNRDNLQNWQRVLTIPFSQSRQNPALLSEINALFAYRTCSYKSLFELLKGDMNQNTVMTDLYARMTWFSALSGYSNPANHKFYQGKQKILPWEYVRNLYKNLLPILENFYPSLHGLQIPKTITKYTASHIPSSQLIQFLIIADYWLKENIFYPSRESISESQDKFYLNLLQHSFAKNWLGIMRSELTKTFLHTVIHPNTLASLELPNQWSTLLQNWPTLRQEKAIKIWEFLFDRAYTTLEFNSPARLQITHISEFFSSINTRLYPTTAPLILPNSDGSLRVEIVDAYTPQELQRALKSLVLAMPILQKCLGDQVIGWTGRQFSIKYNHDGVILKKGAADANPDFMQIYNEFLFPRLRSIGPQIIEIIDFDETHTRFIRDKITGDLKIVVYAHDKMRSQAAGNLINAYNTISFCPRDLYEASYRPVRGRDVLDSRLISKLEPWQRIALRNPIIPLDAVSAYMGLILYYAMSSNSQLKGKTFRDFLQMIGSTDASFNPSITYSEIRAWLGDHFTSQISQLQSWSQLSENQQYQFIVNSYLSILAEMRDECIFGEYDWFQDDFFNDIKFEFGFIAEDNTIRPGWQLHTENSIPRPTNYLNAFYSWASRIPTLDDY